MPKRNETPTPLENPLAANTGGSGDCVKSALPWWRNLLKPKWIALFIALSVLLPGAVYAFSRLNATSGSGESGDAEVSIGEFQFLADASERSAIVGAKFSLHLALIPETEAVTRVRLVTHKYRVQQGVEQLLRQAHGGDFEDPSLGDLRRQLQEQINETLGVRGIADCIVTNLNLKLAEREVSTEPIGDLAGTVPWSD
jgi:hypothetical protein